LSTLVPPEKEEPLPLDFQTLTPTHEQLSAESVLIQAWKKSHEYIRRFNWYADSLELDTTAIDLSRHVGDWAKRVSTILQNKPNPTIVRLIPAPKRTDWAFSAGKWKPDTEDGVPKTRPLAHVSIGDQTLATAVMMCVADAIETEQGNPVPPLAQDKTTVAVHRRQVSSYGNRLFCYWESQAKSSSKRSLIERARFAWGGRRCYRQYFEDYRAFIARPQQVIASLKSGGRYATIFVDVEKFFDRIDRSTLAQKIFAACERQGVPATPKFKRIVKATFNWQWHSDDRALLKEFTEYPDDRGIPQGLVASGFFANAYLLDFDRYMREVVASGKLIAGCHVRDFCRYVDDMRFVVEFANDNEPDDVVSLQQEFSDWINQCLNKYAADLSVNAEKTDVVLDAAPGAAVAVGETMKSLETIVSGPVDAAAANAVLEALGNLLPLAERASREKVGRSNRLKELPEGSVDLQGLFSGHLDVRPDTLERFAANRWRRMFRHLRVLTDAGLPATEIDSTPELLDERARQFARDLIRRWVDDPSNVRLLRIALDLYPDPDQLKGVVLALIEQLLSPSRLESERRIGWYLSAELLRAGATETGFVRKPAELPSSSAIEPYREVLDVFAERMVELASDAPWYVLQQALLYRAVRDKPLKAAQSDGVRDYNILHDVLSGRWKPRRQSVARELPIVIAAARLGHDLTSLERRLRRWVKVVDSQGLKHVRRLFSHEAPELAAIVFPSKQKAIPTEGEHRSPLAELAGQWLRLPAVGAHPERPFQDENATLKLAKALLNLKSTERDSWTYTAPDQVEIRVADWQALRDPVSAQIEVRISPPIKQIRGRPIPTWAMEQGRAWAVRLGEWLRLAMLAWPDGVPPRRSVEKVVRAIPYRGVSGSRAQSYFASYNGRERFGGPHAPITPWLTELLDHLLAWPGRVLPRDHIPLPRNATPQEYLKVVEARLIHQGQLYGRACNLPFYEYEMVTKQTIGPEEKLTVLVAQTVLPRSAEFRADDLQLNDPAIRRRHRSHLASVAKLALETITVRTSYTDGRKIDLIVMPELSVHPNDEDILLRLVDKTRAAIFCGLVFDERDLPGIGKRIINCGRWIIPSYRGRSRFISRIDQGKGHPTPLEIDLGVAAYRPCQWLIRGKGVNDLSHWRLSGAICFDATDLCLAADLRDRSDAFIVPALNKDVPTFDSMVAALHYHMYQPVLLVNSGEYGGSNAQAPYRDQFVRVHYQHHGAEQVAISICELDLLAFRHGRHVPEVPAASHRPNRTKSPPAGHRRGQ